MRLLTERYQTFKNEMEQELSRKEDKIKDLEKKNLELEGSGGPDAELLNRVEAMRRRSIHHGKEQAAVRTIMHKIQSLVDDISLSCGEDSAAYSQFSALASLVNASVDALNS